MEVLQIGDTNTHYFRDELKQIDFNKYDACIAAAINSRIYAYSWYLDAVCDDWDVCQNVKRSFDSGILSLEDYSVARAACSQNMEEDERFCGFQITTCHDLNDCDNSKMVNAKPLERKFCYFVNY